MEKITVQTTDGVTIVGNFFAPASPTSKAILCLHMMPETKDSWNVLAQALADAGIAVLAIDERGHGESTQSTAGVLNFKSFSDEQQQHKRLDVDAALGWLQTQGADLKQTSIVGGSIGANLALDALVRFPQLKSAVALSPGLDFRGLEPAQVVTQFSPQQSVLLVASDDDAYSFESIEQLDTLLTIPHETWKLQGVGHATHMLTNQPELVSRIKEWLLEPQ